MSDKTLQQLKRAWEASGSVQDEATYLRERVRVGELSKERLELAEFAIRGGLLGVEAWIDGLSKWGKKAVVAGTLFLIGPVEDEWNSSIGVAPAETIGAVDGWLQGRLTDEEIAQKFFEPRAVAHQLRLAQIGAEFSEEQRWRYSMVADAVAFTARAAGKEVSELDPLNTREEDALLAAVRDAQVAAKRAGLVVPATSLLERAGMRFGSGPFRVSACCSTIAGGHRGTLGRA